MNGLGMREKLLPRMHRMAATGSARTSRFQVLLLLLAASFLLSPAQGQPIPAACPDTCSDALAYIVIPTQSQTPQTLGGIAANFHADVVALAAANDGNLEDVDNLGDTVVQANQTLRVPLAACSCKGENYSADGITYVVKAGDSLSAIADLSYGGLVTYQAIAAASDISDPNVIQPGKVLTIPIPCSCVSSSASPPAVALSYKVVSADDYTVIGKKFNSTPASIESLNPTVNASTLQANQVIQVPLSACSFNLSTESLDSGLLVAHDAYAITADGCVQCKCSDGLEASCTPSPVVLPCSRTLTCPGTNLTIGSFSSQASGTACEITICQYAGYNETSILTRVQQQSVTAARCSDLAEPPPPPAPPRPIGAPPPEAPPFISPPVPRGTGPRSPPPPGGSSTTAAPPPSSASHTGARALVATWLPVLALLLV